MQRRYVDPPIKVFKVFFVKSQIRLGQNSAEPRIRPLVSNISMQRRESGPIQSNQLFLFKKKALARTESRLIKTNSAETKFGPTPNFLSVNSSYVKKISNLAMSIFFKRFE